MAGCQGLGEQAAQYYRTPKSSYTDMMMHYHEKMLSTFADGIYYDNMYFNADFHPEEAGGPGYVADTDEVDDGKLHAGVGLWSTRDMARRSAVLQHSMGKPHTTLMFHMTSVNVVPIVGWATVNYDWEWHMAGDGQPEMDCSKYGLDVCLPHWQTQSICNNDFQVRFGIDNGDTGVILAQTAGLQTGTVPYAVGEGTGPFNGSCTQRPDLAPSSCALWIGKTDWATCLVHEVRPGGFGCGGTNLSKCMIPASPDGKFKATPGAFNVTNILFAYGYDDESCDVYRFWEPAFPVAVAGVPGVRPLVVRCPATPGAARLLVIFSSFGSGGQVTAQLNQTALGIRAGAQAFDPQLASRSVRLSAGGELAFYLNANDFRMVVVE